MEADSTELLAVCAKIAAAHFSSTATRLDQVPVVIREIYRSISQLAGKDASEASRQPAVPVGESVTHDHIVCLEDGAKLKAMKRHLRSAHKMSIAEYRQRWQLPSNYPMVAPSYSKRRTAIAKEFGLGTVRSRAKKSKR